VRHVFAFQGLQAVAATLALAMLTTTLAGCGSGDRKTYRAGGRVVFQDGSPMPSGKIELSPMGKVNSASGKSPPNPAGVIENDGTFQLTTYKPFDGALPGRYRVIVQELQYETKMGQPPPKPTIDPRYTRYDTSGLEVEIKEEVNNLKISISRNSLRAW
jgi:hypothetical protein